MLLKLKDKKCVGVLGTCLDKIYGNPHSLDQVRARAYLQVCGRDACVSRMNPETCFRA